MWILSKWHQALVKRKKSSSNIYGQQCMSWLKYLASNWLVRVLSALFRFFRALSISYSTFLRHFSFYVLSATPLQKNRGYEWIVSLRDSRNNCQIYDCLNYSSLKPVLIDIKLHTYDGLFRKEMTEIPCLLKASKGAIRSLHISQLYFLAMPFILCLSDTPPKAINGYFHIGTQGTIAITFELLKLFYPLVCADIRKSHTDCQCNGHSNVAIHFQGT